MSNFWSNQRVCVTGGTGFLGFHLVRLLRERGARVRILALPTRPDHPLRQFSDVETHFGDILDANQTRRAVQGCDVVFHTAGIVAVWGPALARMHQVHVEGTRTVLSASDPGTRVVHTSSIVAVGATQDGTSLHEDSPFPLTGLQIDYVHAKRQAEEAALEAACAGRDVVVVSPGYLIGPEDYENSVMTRFCLRFWRGRMPVVPPGGFNLVDVRDVAQGHLRAAEVGQAGRRYILGGENCLLAGFAAQLARVANLRPRWLPTIPSWFQGVVAGLSEVRAHWTGREPYPSFQHVRLNRYTWFVDSARARAELGYTSRPQKETLRDMFDWHQQDHCLKLRGIQRWLLRPAA